MKDLLVRFMFILDRNKGEDIFEYGWSDFNPEKFIKYLFDEDVFTEKEINKFEKYKTAYGVVELHEVINEIVELTEDEEYDEFAGYRRFAEYLIKTKTHDEILALMLNFLD